MTFDWGYTLSLFWYLPLWKASLLVAELSVLAWTAATFLGFFFALAKLSHSPLLRYPSAIYIWFFRSLPLLVLLIFVYNLPQVIPWTRAFLSSAFIAGLLSLILSETAYIAEIHRGGLLSVSAGQREAGRSLGISFLGIQRLIVIPQAVRIALPALANQFVTIVKLTSLISVISLAEILLVGQRLYTQNFKVLETMLAVSVFYVLLVTVFDNLLKLMERRLDVTRKVPKKTPPPIDDIRERLSSHAGGGKTAWQRAGDDPNAYVIEATDVCKRYDETEVLNQVGLGVKAGETVAIIGPSGSGKTTFIRTLNGLATPDRGHISLNGQTLFFDDPTQPGVKRSLPTLDQIEQISMVFQHFNLFPHKTALRNVTLGPRYHRRGSRDRTESEAFAILDKVGLLEHAYKYPHQLSGGQQQRVAIARALAMHPQVILFDEPTSALDPELVGEVLKTIEDLAREGLTMIIVTHEMQFAYRISDRVMFMDGGKAVRIGSPKEIFNGSAEPRLQRFLQDFNVA